MCRLDDGARLCGAPDHQHLQSRPQPSHHGRHLPVHLEVNPVVQSDIHVWLQINLPGAKHHQVKWRHHRHPFTGHGSGPQLLIEHKEGHGKLYRVSGAVHTRLVDESHLCLRCEDFSLLVVSADIGVETHGEQGRHHVELGVGGVEVVLLGNKALLREAAVDQDVPQLCLGLPHDPQCGHVEALVVTEVHLGHLSAHSGVLPGVEHIQHRDVVTVPVARKAPLPPAQLPVEHVGEEHLGPGGARRGDSGQRVPREEHGAQDHHLAQPRLYGQPRQDLA